SNALRRELKIKGIGAHALSYKGTLTGSLRGQRIMVDAVGPNQAGTAVLVEGNHLGLLALLAEFVGRVDGKQRCLTFCLVGAELLAFERNEPQVLAAHNEIPPLRRIGHEHHWWHRSLSERSRHVVPSRRLSKLTRLPRSCSRLSEKI